MRKRLILRKWLLILPLFFALSFTIYLASSKYPLSPLSDPGNTLPVTESPAEIIPTESTNSSLGVYFCPGDDCEQHLFDFLNSANISIHCATFELNLPRVVSLLENRSRDGLDVRLVVDDNYVKEVANLTFMRHDTSKALMHNKFCIVDNKIVYTGSMNPTKACAYKNNNNLVLIESKYLAANYEAEFEELWAGLFGKGGKVPYPKIVWNGIRIENYFCPEDHCRAHIRDELAKANQSVYFMEFSFTDTYIATDLVLKHQAGVDVRGVFEKTKISNYSAYNLLKYQGIDVRLDHNKYNMHHKVWIIDNRTVITGSYNPSTNAEYDNDENILIIEDPEIASEFLQEFWIVFEPSNPK